MLLMRAAKCMHAILKKALKSIAFWMRILSTAKTVYADKMWYQRATMSDTLQCSNVLGMQMSACQTLKQTILAPSRRAKPKFSRLTFPVQFDIYDMTKLAEMLSQLSV